MMAGRRLETGANAELDILSREFGRPAQAAIPLTPIQHWFFEQSLPNFNRFSQAILMDYAHRPQIGALQQALEFLVHRHDALRMRFEPGESGWRQFEERQSSGVTCNLFDLPTGDERENDAVTGAIANDLQRNLDLARGPLLQAALLQHQGSRRGRLLLIVHHLAVDIRSWRILLEGLAEAGDGFRAPIQSPPASSFQGWAKLLAEYAESMALREESAYWLAQCCGEQFPGLSPVRTIASTRKISTALPAEESQALISWGARSCRAQPSDLVLTALAEVLTQWHRNRPVLIAMEGHGREDIGGADVSGTVGWFTSIYPIRLVPRQHSDATRAVIAVRDIVRRLPKGGIGYGVLKYLSPHKGIANELRSLPQAEIGFNYTGTQRTTVGGLGPFERISEAPGQFQSPEAVRPFGIDIVAGVSDGVLHIDWIHSETEEGAVQIEQMASACLDVLRRFNASL